MRLTSAHNDTKSNAEIDELVDEFGKAYTDMSRDYDLIDYDEVTAFAQTFADAARRASADARARLG